VSRAERDQTDDLIEVDGEDPRDDLMGELGDGGDDLAANLPESLTINVDLPAPVHSIPDDEVAVAIDDVAVNPGALDVVEPTTTSVTVVAVPAVDAHLYADEAFSETTYSRRDRLRGEPSNTPEPAAMLTATVST